MRQKNKNVRNLELSNFYCINCGKKGLDLMRQASFRHSKMHRKKLYCFYCKTEVNHIECKTIEDVENFLNDFNEGKYIQEAADSISFCNSGVK